MKRLSIALLVLLVAIGCKEGTCTGESRTERIAAAIVDASRELTASDIYDSLVSLKYGANDLVQWHLEGGDTLLLVASIQSTDWSYGTVEAGQSVVTGSSSDDLIWVMIPGELDKALMDEPQMADSLAVNDRLIEMIGLRPDGAESIINLFWVDKSSLLRPSYDPNPATTHGALEYPASGLPAWYEQWFEANVEYCYEAPAEGLNYPFTRLGYTYDWGEGQSRYGLSEFVTIPSTQLTFERRAGCWSYYNSLY